MKRRKRYRLKKSVKQFMQSFFLFVVVLIVLIISIKIVIQHGRENIIDSPILIELDINKKELYLIKGETYQINYNDNWSYKVLDNNIIDIKEGLISALNAGDTKITVSNPIESVDINVHVTDLLVTYTLNNKKDLLVCHLYSDEQAALLDKTLEFRINEKGYQTRAGAVEAARFLTLNFPYRLKYFYENGRLDRSNPLVDEVDGEGRYYHKGLYLTDNKFSELKVNLRGPAPWGCPMYNDTTKVINNNGFDCSGFVTWVLYNAGYDPGDVGAGKNNYNDITDIGNVVMFSDANAFENVKVGDLVGRKGHIAMLIGISEGKYYIAEALNANQFDIHVYSYTKDELIASEFEYFVDLELYYQNDGNLSNMW